MAEAATTGLIDLEKELTCSICTEILYQPLTLLDCLHTFCGSCLKEWFSFKAAHADPTKRDPFSCPSCRASVRETRPNATVTTLLEMYVQANPGRARTEQEKAELRLRYTSGEDVLPKIKIQEETDEEAADRRMVEEARELSLRDVGIRGQGSYERGIRHRQREGGNDNRNVGGRRSSPQRSRLTATEQQAQARRIEHQSSLRSLLSNSDIDSSEMEEEILRQIMDDGILDGIDLDHIDVSQEDELSEKIAEAYRRRHQRPRSRDYRNDRSRRSSSHDHRSPPQDRSQNLRVGRASRASDDAGHSSHPPLSRPHLLEAYPTGPAHRRRTSSEHRRQTSPSLSSSTRSSTEVQRAAARSATDLSSRQRRASNEPQPNSRPFLDHNRGGTDSDRPRTNEGAHRSENRQPQSSRNADSHSPNDSSTRNQPAEMTAAAPSRDVGGSSPLLPPQPSEARDGRPVSARRMSPSLTSSSKTSNVAQEPKRTYTEPSISCNRCGKASLEYDLHMKCDVCNAGDYHLCLRCYRLGRGCLHWFGFGDVAPQRHDAQARLEAPSHRLSGHRYLPSPVNSRVPSKSNTSYSDPASRLESGLFCSNCSRFTPGCYWSCDTCNDGEWGFCNDCLNQGACCTHALIPTALKTHLPPTQPVSVMATPHRQKADSKSPSTKFYAAPQGPATTLCEQLQNSFVPLEVSIFCKLCTYPIPPSATRYHCPQCNAGDYDICTPCYSHLVSRGILKPDDGPNGWRRCPQGHRMLVVGFQDSAAGQKRLVVEDLVGGRALREENLQPAGNNASKSSEKQEWQWRDDGQQQRRTTQTMRAHAAAAAVSTSNLSLSAPTEGSGSPLFKKFPPSGGIGMHFQALWARWPAEGVTDELAFPRGAEIRECEDINGDWFWGIYCGRKGLFPGAYGKVVGEVS